MHAHGSDVPQIISLLEERTSGSGSYDACAEKVEYTDICLNVAHNHICGDKMGYVSHPIAMIRKCQLNTDTGVRLREDILSAESKTSR